MTTREWAEYFEREDIENVQKGIYKVMNGHRPTYLGYHWERRGVE